MMKLIFAVLLLTLAMTSQVRAGASAECTVIDGFYLNSDTPLTDMNFETVVDIFSLNNAHILNLKLNGEGLRFFRSSMNVKKQTNMTFYSKKNGKPDRVINLMIDRTPRLVRKTNEFYGNMIISPEASEENHLGLYFSMNKLVYNFYCRF